MCLGSQFNIQYLSFSKLLLLVLSPPAFQSTPHAGINHASSLRTIRTNGVDDSLLTSHDTSSAALLQNLYEKIERQSQVLPYNILLSIFRFFIFSLNFNIGEFFVDV